MSRFDVPNSTQAFACSHHCVFRLGAVQKLQKSRLLCRAEVQATHALTSQSEVGQCPIAREMGTSGLFRTNEMELLLPAFDEICKAVGGPPGPCLMHERILVEWSLVCLTSRLRHKNKRSVCNVYERGVEMTPDGTKKCSSVS